MLDTHAGNAGGAVTERSPPGRWMTGWRAWLLWCCGGLVANLRTTFHPTGFWGWVSSAAAILMTVAASCALGWAVIPPFLEGFREPTTPDDPT
jgi:hypothetical protein